MGNCTDKAVIRAYNWENLLSMHLTEFSVAARSPPVNGAVSFFKYSSLCSISAPRTTKPTASFPTPAREAQRRRGREPGRKEGRTRAQISSRSSRCLPRVRNAEWPAHSLWRRRRTPTQDTKNTEHLGGIVQPRLTDASWA